MKRILAIIGTIMFAYVLPGQAQEEVDRVLKVAVFDPSMSGTASDDGIRVSVREIISAAFVNFGQKYSIVERSLLDKIMQEAKFSNTDAVDEGQATQLGKLAGADKVVLSVVTQAGRRNVLSIKLIDVRTATVEKQRTKVVDAALLLDAVEPLTLAMLGQESTNRKATDGAVSQTTAPPKQSHTPTAGRNTARNSSRSSSHSTALVKSVIDFINQDLEEKVNRYPTDEERLKHVSSNGRLKELVRFAAKYAVALPETQAGQVAFFCPGREEKGMLTGKDTPLFLFVDGKMIGAGTMEKGVAAVVENDNRPHLITLCRYSSRIYSGTVDFSIQTECVFQWNGKEISL